MTTYNTGDLVCPKCGKPTIYVGDPPENIEDVLCQCGKKWAQLDFTKMNIGWICPRCGKSNSPFKDQCTCTPHTITTTTTVSTPW